MASRTRTCCPTRLALDADPRPHGLDQALADRQPRPLPPYWRVVERSAWMNGGNSSACRSAGCRSRVPHLETQPHPRAGRPAAARTATSTCRAAVNLSPLPIRLTSTWRSRVGSPRTTSGAGRRARTQLRPRSAACGANSGAPGRRRPRTEKSTCSSSSRPASIREKSRMSLMMLSRCRPEGGSSRRTAPASASVLGRQQVRHAQHAGHRRADLVAHGGQELRLLGRLFGYLPACPLQFLVLYL